MDKLNNLRDYLILGYKEAQQDEANLLKNIEDPQYIKHRVVSSCPGVIERKSWYYLFVEKDIQKASDLAEQLPNSLLINGDGRNVELFE